MWLPLFPLNTVLWPGLPLDLHIFEERYKEMIRLCLDGKSPFGVVSIREGSEALGPVAVPADVGTIAVITEVRELEGGRYFLKAAGRERFRIVSLDHSRSYLAGETAQFELEDSSHEIQVLELKRSRLLELADEYLAVLTDNRSPGLSDSIRAHSVQQTAYIASDLLQIGMPRKQALLESPGLDELLESLLGIYAREILVLRGLREQKMDGTGDASSWN